MFESRRIRRIRDQCADKSLLLAILPLSPAPLRGFFVEAPIPYPIEFDIAGLTPDTPDIRAQIQTSINNMLFQQAFPGQTIYAAWKSAAVLEAAGVQSFRLTNTLDDQMPAPGYMAALGDISYEP